MKTSTEKPNVYFTTAKKGNLGAVLIMVKVISQKQEKIPQNFFQKEKQVNMT